jgi:hypothetical protein
LVNPISPIYMGWDPDREERGRLSGQRMLEKAKVML